MDDTDSPIQYVLTQKAERACESEPETIAGVLASTFGAEMAAGYETFRMPNGDAVAHDIEDLLMITDVRALEAPLPDALRAARNAPRTSAGATWLEAFKHWRKCPVAKCDAHTVAVRTRLTGQDPGRQTIHRECLQCGWRSPAREVRS